MEITTRIIENDWLPRDTFDFGWGNGYVILPKGHKYHGIDYNDIPVDIHGGLTYSRDIEYFSTDKVEAESGAWVIGFDTAHHGDTLAKWPKERVQEEANKLLKQML